MFAIVKTGGKQYKVAKDSTIRVEKKKVGQNYVYIVSLELSGKNNKKSVFMKNVIYAQ